MKKKPEGYQIIATIVEVESGKVNYLYPALKIENGKIVDITKIESDIPLLEFDNPEANRIEKEIIEDLKKLSEIYPEKKFFYASASPSIKKLKEIL